MCAPFVRVYSTVDFFVRRKPNTASMESVRFLRGSRGRECVVVTRGLVPTGFDVVIVVNPRGALVLGMNPNDMYGRLRPCVDVNKEELNS